jgi:hypothetical protein
VLEIYVTEEEKQIALEFSFRANSEGQSFKNYRSDNPRSFHRRVADTFRGKILEVVLGNIWNVPVDLETGDARRVEGSHNTADCGADIEYQGKTYSFNAIASNCGLLAIPLYKLQEHQDRNIDYLLLGTTFIKAEKNFWNEIILKTKFERFQKITIEGIVSLQEFAEKGFLVESGIPPERFDRDNWAMNKRDLHFWDCDIPEQELHRRKQLRTS